VTPARELDRPIDNARKLLDDMPASIESAPRQKVILLARTPFFVMLAPRVYIGGGLRLLVGTKGLNVICDGDEAVTKKYLIGPGCDALTVWPSK
jgi:hypothetical protein